MPSPIQMGLYLRRGALVLPDEDTGEAGKPARSSQQEPNHSASWSQTFQPPELREKKYLLFQAPAIWHFVMEPELTEMVCFYIF